jgi:hypothetical protein
MIRRRRRVREIPFSFDSFLDIVANIVGIIIRLILVVWVGARSYSSIQSVVRPGSPAAVSEEQQEPEDPLQQELARHRRDLAEAQQRLLDQLRQLQQVQETQTLAESELAGLVAQAQALEKEQSSLERAAREGHGSASAAALSLAELRRRGQKLTEEIRALEQAPPPKKVLRYRTPVSRPVQSEELLFECRNGRVTFVDIAGLLVEVREKLQDKGKLLKSQWQVLDTTEPVGAFRLRYTLERERGVLESVVADGAPEGNASFRYGLSEWVVEPVALARGETESAALGENSEFRRIVDGLDPQQQVVTFWVYPDSFPLYRRLRDFLYDRDVVVAGRPLPESNPIGFSRHGTASRGQ